MTKKAKKRPGRPRGRSKAIEFRVVKDVGVRPSPDQLRGLVKRLKKMAQAQRELLDDLQDLADAL